MDWDVTQWIFIVLGRIGINAEGASAGCPQDGGTGLDSAQWIGLALGGIGAATGIGSLVFARLSAKASDRSARAAKESFDLQMEAWREEKRALLTWVDPQFQWEMTSEDGNTGRFTIGLRNEGRSPAFDTSVGLYFHQNNRYTFSGSTIGTFDDIGMQYHREYTPQVFSPGTIHLFTVDASRRDLGAGDMRHVTFRISYRDGLGGHSLDVKVWLGGAWSPDEFSFSVISTCLDGTLVLMGTKDFTDSLRIEREHDLPCPAP